MVLVSLEADLKGIMEESTGKVRLFWDQQLQATKTMDHRLLRWHPMMIKWYLN